MCMRALQLIQCRRNVPLAGPGANAVEAAPPILSESVSHASTVDKSTVLGSMKGKSVCAGWDVVFSLGETEINRQLCEQYNDRQGIPEFMRETGLHVKEETTSTGNSSKTEFEFKFGAPRMQFLLNNSQFVKVYMRIISGTYRYE